MLGNMTGEAGAGDVTMDSVRLYAMTQDGMVEPLWSASMVLAACWIVTLPTLHYGFGWPGTAAAAAISFSIAALVYWRTCKGPRSMEVSDTRLRLVDHRGRVVDQFERADVSTLEWNGTLLHISTPASWHRYVITVHDVAPHRVLRLRTALERHGWLQPEPDQAATGV
jgi:hypothetical protein